MPQGKSGFKSSGHFSPGPSCARQNSMTTFNDKPSGPRPKSPTPEPDRDNDRKKRLADALRDNLRRRKAATGSTRSGQSPKKRLDQ